MARRIPRMLLLLDFPPLLGGEPIRFRAENL